MCPIKKKYIYLYNMCVISIEIVLVFPGTHQQQRGLTPSARDGWASATDSKPYRRNLALLIQTSELCKHFLFG